jgi:hypothetical protein
MKHSTLLMSSFVALFGLAACDAAMVANQQAAAEAKAEVKPDAEVEAKADAKVEGDSGIQGIANGIVAEADTKADTNVNVNVDAKVEVNANIKGEDFDLETINYLIKKNKVKDAKALEKKINNHKEKINDIDIDGDGKVDYIKIVEIKKDDDTVVYEFHAVPSSSKDEKAAVVIAYVTMVPDKSNNVLIVKATYAPVIVGHDTIVYEYTTPIVIKENKVVVVEGGFYGWVYAPRPAYVGVVVWGPPVVVVHHDHHGCWPPGHCKHHHKHKHKGKGKGKWHW